MLGFNLVLYPGGLGCGQEAAAGANLYMLSHDWYSFFTYLLKFNNFSLLTVHWFLVTGATA
jgi:hypothetical protein